MARSSRSGRRSCTSAAATARPPSRRSTSRKTVGTGNFDKWAEGPKLPEPRADASVAYVAGSIYVIGGRDASGAPTTTVFVLSPDSQTGQLGEWSTAKDLALPEARSETASAITPDGLLIVGGRNADGPVATTLKTKLNSQGKLGAWSQEQPLVTPQAGATGVVIGDFLWLYGGSDANGPTAKVQRGSFGTAAAEGLPANPDLGKLIRWDVNDAANLPAPRANGSGWGANGAIYMAGGNDGSGPKTELYWAVPTTQRRHPGMEAPAGERPARAARGRAGGHLRPERDPRRGHDLRRRGRHPASAPTPRRRARSSSSAWSARPCPDSRSRARSASSSATSTPRASGP